MKKMMSLSLAAALALAAAPTTYADDSVQVTTNTKAEVKADANKNKDGKDDSEEAATTDETTDETETVEAKGSVKSEGVLKAVKTKKELIELRQALKANGEWNEEQKAQYQELVAELEKLQDLKTALEVQLELIEKLQTNAKEDFKKLGELYEKTGKTEVKAFVNGKQPEFDVPPFIEKGRTLVPIRAISAALKADVKWEAATRTVVITRGEQSITLYLDKKEALVNGKTVTLETLPVIKKGRVFLPLRFVSEQLNASVTWQQEGKIVIIEDPAVAEKAETTDEAETAK